VGLSQLRFRVLVGFSLQEYCNVQSIYGTIWRGLEAAVTNTRLPLLMDQAAKGS
jgi:hypothetical protein